MVCVLIKLGLLRKVDLYSVTVDKLKGSSAIKEMHNPQFYYLLRDSGLGFVAQCC